MGDRRGTWVSVALLAVALACSPVALAGCTSQGRPRSAASESRTAIATKAQEIAISADAQRLGGVLQMWELDPPDFSAEPSGDLHPDGYRRVYGYLSQVTTSPARIALDIAQLYSGESADRQAAKDRQSAPENGFYERNARLHVQTFPVAADTAVVGVFDGDADRLYGRDDAQQLTPVSFADFASRYNAQPASSRSDRGYWVELYGDEVRGICEQYAD